MPLDGDLRLLLRLQFAVKPFFVEAPAASDAARSRGVAKLFFLPVLFQAAVTADGLAVLLGPIWFSLSLRHDSLVQ